MVIVTSLGLIGVTVLLFTLRSVVGFYLKGEGIPLRLLPALGFVLTTCVCLISPLVVVAAIGGIN